MGFFMVMKNMHNAGHSITYCCLTASVEHLHGSELSIYIYLLTYLLTVLVQQPDTDQWAIEGFYIYYGLFDDQQIDYQRQMVLGSSVRHAVLTHLDGGLAYSIRMQSYTAAGTLSQFSNTVVKQTLGNYLSHSYSI